MKDEALKLALEALQFSGNIWHMDCKKDEAITAIKEALAQPAQEPLDIDQRFAIIEAWENGNGTPHYLIDMVEAAHGIKETEK